MSEELKRYRYGLAGTVCMFEDAMGGWVRYCDHVAELNRRQEAKPLTVEQIRRIEGEIFTAHCPNALNGKLFEVGPILDIIADKIHAALPPDQSVRIVELKNNLEIAVEILEQFDNASNFDLEGIEWDGWDNLRQFLSRIKAGNS